MLDCLPEHEGDSAREVDSMSGDAAELELRLGRRDDIIVHLVGIPSENQQTLPRNRISKQRTQCTSRTETTVTRTKVKTFSFNSTGSYILLPRAVPVSFHRVPSCSCSSFDVVPVIWRGCP